METLIWIYMCVVAVVLQSFQAQSQVTYASVPKSFTHDKVIVCYLTRWAAYREGDGKFDIFDTEPSLCTHLIYAFVGLDENSNKIRSIDPWQDLEVNYGLGGLKHAVELKKKNPYMKVSVGIGGWNEGSIKYSNMVADPKRRKIFVTSVVNFLEVHKLDGLDIFWDCPTQRGGKPDDRKNLLLLVKELNEAFEPNRKLLTATLRTGYMDSKMNDLYDLVQLNFYLDYMHIMAYDYHGAWEGFVGANAPLRGMDDNDILNIEYTVKYLLSFGITTNKLVLGLPMFGRTFTFNTRVVNEVEFLKTPTTTTGFAGRFSKENGFIGYNEICLQLMNKTSEWEQFWHNQTVTPYLRDDTRFISYDNTRSFANKVKYVIDSGFGGVFVYSIATDDFRGSCDEEVDTYIDFIERFNKIANVPILKTALENFNTYEIQTEYYSISNGKPRLKLPSPQFGNYPLLRTVNEAITLSLEEIKVNNEIERILDERAKLVEKGSVPCFRTCNEICFYGF